MTNIVATPFEKIRPGNAAMYYPECNVLVPRTADPRSHTPAFKLIPITIEPTKQARQPDLTKDLHVIRN